MGFDPDSFKILPPDTCCWEADLPAILDYYQTTYFAGAEPVRQIAFAALPDSPACVFPTIGRIEIDSRFRTFAKLCCFLVLHELINYKLFLKGEVVQPYSGREFRDEVKTLWEAGAYEGLL